MSRQRVIRFFWLWLASICIISVVGLCMLCIGLSVVMGWALHPVIGVVLGLIWACMIPAAMYLDGVED